MSIAAPELPIRTQRLRLRGHRDSDAGPLAAYYGDPVSMRYMLTGPMTVAEVESMVTARVGDTDPQAEDDALKLVAEHDGVIVGDVVLFLRDDPVRQAEVGWIFDPAHVGRGLATEAAHALLSIAFAHYRLHRVFAQIDARNDRSAALCERIGMRREAHHRLNWWSKGEWTDTMIYAILAQEWSIRP